ncbi:UDP-N-acetylmuramate--L-alanine ligase [Pleurocapsa sp. CCALA 161]|uniref:UDP-N-acetylmuramate--L-alanine ligase n=1 Tax=Pleurocapsa sp. CCALA 161 TaxID=2107688 RepID=UPI000D060DD9|nr:UDP-N-acetylmuramate--L-alanine ligase [Pleurocapsa sp. CCALA 161]PSB08414.1 UDP-N-acetylmuramate--L-alanine ligase [Pleurocapsa sp. CCALA 161]
MAGVKEVAKVDLKGKPFHFIGIGGIGMSALAQIVAQRQLPVSGSDLRSSHITDRLEALGAKIFYRQEARNLDFFVPTPEMKRQPVSAGGSSEALLEMKVLDSSTQTLLPQVICSTAIAQTNPEYQAAVQLGCPIFHRSDLLAALIDEYQGIAVSGTHGKTTTSSLIGYMLFKCQLDPTIIVGGEVDAWDGNARSGQGEYLVAEADESDGSLVKHHPSIGIITNIELDHPDRYQDIQEVVGIFQSFAGQCNTLIGCIDDPIIRDELALTISYGLNPDWGADYTAKNIIYHGQGSNSQIWERGVCLGKLELPLLGEHNLNNALAAIAVGRQVGLEFSTIAQAIATFGGTKRRFEHRGEVNGITLIDDYAHHPSEIKVTLTAARQRVSGNNSLQRVVAIFQPHRYSRTKTFLQEFAQAFKDADAVVITDIYSAGENNTFNISGSDLVKAITIYHHQVYYHPNVNSIENFLGLEILKPGDLAIFLGAGNLNQSIPKTIDLLSMNSEQ